MLSNSKRQRRLRNLGETRQSWNQMGRMPARATKIGESTDFYVSADERCVRLKSPGASMQLDREATRVNPGNSLKFQIHHGKVGFDQWYLNPLITNPSTAVQPIPTLVPCMPVNDPDIQVLAGVFDTLESLAALL